MGTGTSFVAPYVTGAWAVLKARKPVASVGEILAVLANSGKPVMDRLGEVSDPGQSGARVLVP